MTHVCTLFEQLGFIYFLPLSVLFFFPRWLDPPRKHGFLNCAWAPNIQICDHWRGGYQLNILSRRPDIFISTLVVGNHSKTCYSFSCEEKQPFWTQLNLSLVIMKIGASGTSSGTTVSFAQNHNCQKCGRLTFVNLILYTRWFSYPPKEGHKNPQTFQRH